MKTVAVLVYDLMIEYNITVVDGIVSYFKDKDDVNLLIAPVNVPKNNPVFYDYQHWTGVKALNSDQIDTIIVVTNSFINYVDYEELAKFLEPVYSKPIVSVGGKLDIPGSKYTIISCEKAYDQIIEHLSEKHNRKNIAYFSASLAHSPESEMRVNAYKASLKKYGLEFHEDWVLPGDFTPGTAEQKFLELFKSKEDVKFDAILCANDYTASGCISALYSLGLRVPDDVCVVGFDDTYIAVACYPTLTTINQDIKSIGYTAAEASYKILLGEEVPECSASQAIPIYRQSCGCLPTTEHNSSYITQEGVFVEEDLRHLSGFNTITQSAQNLITIYNLLGFMDADDTFQDFFASLPANMRHAAMDYLAFFLYDEPVIVNNIQPFELPEKVKLLATVNNSKGKIENFSEKGGEEFNPHKSLVPKCVKKDMEKDVYMFYTLFEKQTNYGYLICRLSTTNYNLISIYIKILANALINSYQMTKEKGQKELLVQKNFNLNKQSKTDELTQIYNRRGFFEYGQNLIDLVVGADKSGCVFFFDLDGLKKINDTYGHEIGDLAIKTEAKVLTSAFRDSDLVGRLSGDEFAVVAVGFAIDKVDVLRERLLRLNKELSEEAKLPFTLSISVGPMEFNSGNCNLQNLLKAADKNLYEEKRIKHAK